MMFSTVGETDWEKPRKSLWKGGFRWMKKQRWDLRGRKWEQVNVPEILFLSKQDVLWCFIYKATKAQKAERAGVEAKSTVRGTGSSDRKRGLEEAGEVERRREDRWCSIPHRGRSRNMTTDEENDEQTNRQEIWMRQGLAWAWEEQEVSERKRERCPVWYCSGDDG